MALKVLIVSTDRGTVDVLARSFSELGIQIQECSDPSAAIDCIGTHCFDAVVLDSADKKGAATLIEEFKSSPTHQRSLVIGLVGADEEAQQVFGAGANLVIYKP